MMCIYFADINIAKKSFTLGQVYIFPMQLETQLFGIEVYGAFSEYIKYAVIARPELILFKFWTRNESMRQKGTKNPGLDQLIKM